MSIPILTSFFSGDIQTTERDKIGRAARAYLFYTTGRLPFSWLMQCTLDRSFSRHRNLRRPTTGIYILLNGIMIRRQLPS